MSNGQRHLHGVKLRPLLTKLLFVSEMHIELATPDELHDEEDAMLSLEHEVHVHHEGVPRLHEDLLLQKAVTDQGLFEEHVLPDGLHSVHFVVPLDKEHFAEAALAEQHLNLKFFN